MEGYRITVRELKARFEEMIDMVASGERVVITNDDGTPIAGIVGLTDLDKAEATLELLRRNEIEQ